MALLHMCVCVSYGGRWRSGCQMSAITGLTPSNFLICQEQAFETSQKYKEGKYIIEMSHMVKDNGWD